MKTFPRMHVSLYVSNISESLNFYTAFFGVPAVKVRKGYAKYILEEPSLIISFVENAERVQQNFGHLGFQVESMEILNQKLAEARSKNLIAREESEVSCCYAKQDKFWLNDPDGVQWEVYYFHGDAEFNDPHYEAENVSACCIADTVREEKKALVDVAVNSCDSGEASCCN